MKYIKQYEKTLFYQISEEQKEIKFINFARHGGPDTEFKELINSGVDINCKIGGDTALIWTAYKGIISKVKILIEAGADLDIQDEGDSTALILAAQAKNMAIVEYLIEAGANWNIKNDNDTDFLGSLDWNAKLRIIQQYPEQYKKYLMIQKSEKFNL
jgi:ankyrin repeat protein